MGCMQVQRLELGQPFEYIQCSTGHPLSCQIHRNHGRPGLSSSRVTLPPNFSISAIAFASSVVGSAAPQRTGASDKVSSSGSAMRFMESALDLTVGNRTAYSIAILLGRKICPDKLDRLIPGSGDESLPSGLNATHGTFSACRLSEAVCLPAPRRLQRTTATITPVAAGLDAIGSTPWIKLLRLPASRRRPAGTWNSGIGQENRHGDRLSRHQMRPRPSTGIPPGRRYGPGMPWTEPPLWNPRSWRKLDTLASPGNVS